jgi:hypothetical protein
LAAVYEIGNPQVASDVEFLGWQMVVARVAAENRTGRADLEVALEFLTRLLNYHYRKAA